MRAAKRIFLKSPAVASVCSSDFRRNLQFRIPENFNFAYDVMDVWAEDRPDKLALLWTDDEGKCMRLTFKDIKEQTDRTAAYFKHLGIGRGDMVMLILKIGRASCRE